MTRKSILFSCGVLLALAGGAFLLRAQNARPNVVFITLDSLRADHLGCYGYKRNTSPHIDALSEKGVLFSQAIAQASWTTASVSSIVTSLYPEHGLKQVGSSLSSKDENLVRLLKENGYATALFSNASPILDSAFLDIKSDFDFFNTRKVKASGIVDLASDWLGRISGKPFFLWIYLFDTHAPYRAESRYFEEFLSDELFPHKSVPIAEDDGRMNEFFSFGRISRFVAEKGIMDTSYYIAKYDGGIKYADEQIGRFLQALRDKRMDKNTLIVLFADHGESMTEHDFYFNHSHYLYDGLVRVPLLMVFPGKIPPEVVSLQVPMLDVMPTTLEILGIKKAESVEGKSLLPLIRGDKARIEPYAFSESSFAPFFPRSLRSENWKFIYNRGRGHNPNRKEYELYDLKADPGEVDNLIEKRPALAASLKGELDQWGKKAKTLGLLRMGDPDEQRKVEFRSLGYVQ